MQAGCAAPAPQPALPHAATLSARSDDSTAAALAHCGPVAIVLGAAQAPSVVASQAAQLFLQAVSFTHTTTTTFSK